MKKLKVNNKNYAIFKYPAYLDTSNKETEKSKNGIYEVGDVVVIREETIGVVIGCIVEVQEELRTDMEGMVCFSDLRFATVEDFDKDLRFQEKLKIEVLKG